MAAVASKPVQVCDSSSSFRALSRLDLDVVLSDGGEQKHSTFS